MPKNEEEIINYLKKNKYFFVKYPDLTKNLNFPLKDKSWKDLTKVPEVINNKLNLELKNYKQFIGHKKKSLTEIQNDT